MFIKKEIQIKQRFVNFEISKNIVRNFKQNPKNFGDIQQKYKNKESVSKNFGFINWEFKKIKNKKPLKLWAKFFVVVHSI